MYHGHIHGHLGSHVAPMCCVAVSYGAASSASRHLSGRRTAAVGKASSSDALPPRHERLHRVKAGGSTTFEPPGSQQEGYRPDPHGLQAASGLRDFETTPEQDRTSFAREGDTR